jgi:hypothetical protein
MGTQKTTTTNTIPGAGGQESALRDLLLKFAQSQEGQFGDLSKLAQGDIGGPTADDLALISQTLGRTRDITQRNLSALSQEGQARLGEQLAAQGLSGSGEAFNRAMLERDLIRQGANLQDQSRIEANQALMQLPFQRAQVQLGANQTLLQGLLGASNPLLQSFLGERQAQGTETVETPFSPAQAIQMGGALAGAIPTGGLSLAAMPQQFSPVNPAQQTLQGGFSRGLLQGGRR